jgi:hypothetical protein
LGDQSIVGAAAQTASCREQLELGACGDQPFGRIENVDDVTSVRGHDADS